MEARTDLAPHKDGAGGIQTPYQTGRTQSGSGGTGDLQEAPEPVEERGARVSQGRLPGGRGVSKVSLKKEGV